MNVAVHSVTIILAGVCNKLNLRYSGPSPICSSVSSDNSPIHEFLHLAYRKYVKKNKLKK